MDGFKILNDMFQGRSAFAGSERVGGISVRGEVVFSNLGLFLKIALLRILRL